MTEKSPQHTRFIYSNIHSLKTTEQAYQIPVFYEEIQRQHADLYGFTEHKLDTTQYQVRQTFRQHLRTFFTKSKLEVSSSELTTITPYKPGGTGILAINNTCGRICQQGSDRYGRWSWMRLQSKDQKIILLITAYQPCKHPTNKIGITAFHQQEAAFKNERRQTHDPHINFRKDLIQFIHESQERHEEIVLAGDFNEDDRSQNSVPYKLMTACKLSDAWRSRHPHIQEPITYNRGRKRLDFIFTSPTLIDSIEKIGYLPFEAGFTTDHRSIFVDFKTTKFFGLQPQLQQHMQRGIQSNHKKNRITYLSTAHQYATKHNLFSTLHDLCSSTERNDTLIEQLDTILGTACALGEKRCRQYRPYWWTSRIHQLRIYRRYLQKHLRDLLNNVNQTSRYQRALEKREVPDSIPTTLIETRRKLSATKHEIRNIQLLSRKHRDAELIQRQQTASNSNQLQAAKILKAIKKVEHRNDAFHMFQNIKQAQNKSGVTDISIPSSWPPPLDPDHPDIILPDPKLADKNQETFRSINVPTEITQYLLMRNKRHFGQSKGTPFTVPPLSIDLNWQASTDQAEYILQGNYDNQDLDSITSLILQHCRSITTLDSIPAPLTMDEFVAKLRVWNERTSTSPSGRHLGHYKVLLKSYASDTTSPMETELEQYRNDLLRAHLQIVNYCLKHGYSLQRWKNVVNIMILKEPGNTKIHRLRVIHLFEADYNLVLGVKWKQLLRKAEKDKSLHPGQAGSRPGRDAPSLVLLEELKNDITLSTRYPLLNFDNDASSCYDRIIPALASLIARKYGLHRNVVIINATTLQEARYKLKTEWGVSDEDYQHTTMFPLYGTGQGSGNSPMIWCIISSVLFTCHSEKAHGAIFESPDRTQSIHLSIVGFVDDSTSITNDFRSQPPSPETLLVKLEHDVQLWHDLLWSSGGCLELPKCSYHFIYFDFKPDGTPYARTHFHRDAISVNDPHGNPIRIPQKSSFNPHKTLGHYRSPIGPQKHQLKELSKKMRHISNILATSPATRQQTKIFYHALYLPATYVLPQCHFTPQELQAAEKKSTPILIARSGYLRNTSKALLYGPTTYGGAGMIPWSVLQGEGQILNFLKYWRSSDSLVTPILKIALSWFQYQTGVGFPILQFPQRRIPSVDSRYLPSLRQFLATIQGSIEVDEPFLPNLQRAHDRFIMDIAFDLDIFTTPEIDQINRCRMAIGAITLADLTEADGITLAPGTEWGDLDGFPSRTKYHKINQPPMQPLFWLPWRRLMTLISDDKRQLHLPMGQWLFPATHLHRSWNAYYDTTTQQLHRQQPTGQFLRYDRFDTRFINGIPETWQPTDTSYPVSIKHLSSDIWHLTSPPAFPEPISPAPHIETFPEFLSNLPHWEQTLFDQLFFQVPPYEILQLFTNNSPILLVSDGSEQAKLMTFGWHMATSTGTRLIRCSGPAFGRGTSHRAEATGILSASRLLFHLSRFCATPLSTPIHFYSDNSGLITRLNQRHQHDTCYPAATLAPDWDIIEATYATNKPLAHLKYRHVKGHQDRNKHISELNLPAQLNVAADHEAGSQMWDQPTPSNPFYVPFVPFTKAQLHLSNITITSKYRWAIRFASTAPALFEKLRTEHSWSLNTWRQIDLLVLKGSLKRNPDLSTFIFKFQHNLLPTQATKNRWYQTSPLCPACQELDNITHMFHCSHQSFCNWRRTFLQGLRKKLQTTNTDYALMTTLLDCLEIWLDGEQTHYLNYPPQHKDAIISQTEIGWHEMIQGYWSEEWTTLQHLSLENRNLVDERNTGLTWAVSITGYLFQQAHQLWEIHNKHIHKHTTSLKDQDALSRKIFRITWLHQQKHRVLAEDRDHLFISNLESFLQTATIQDITHWLRQYEATIMDSIRTASSTAVQHAKPLTHYFPSRRQQTSPSHPRTRYNPKLHHIHERKHRRKKALQNPNPQARISSYFQFNKR